MVRVEMVVSPRLKTRSKNEWEVPSLRHISFLPTPRARITFSRLETIERFSSKAGPSSMGLNGCRVTYHQYS